MLDRALISYVEVGQRSGRLIDHILVDLILLLPTLRHLLVLLDYESRSVLVYNRKHVSTYER